MIEVKYIEEEKVRYLEPIKKQAVDLYLCYCGLEACTPSYSFGPAVRSHYLIHYVISGKGSLTINNKTYNLEKNQGFLIPADTVSYYEADKDDPWEYMWIAFNGVKAESYINYANLNSDNIIFEYSKDDLLKNYIFQMLEFKHLNFENELKLQGLLYLFMSTLVSCKKNDYTSKSYKSTEIYLEKSIEFIENNYFNNIKINDIASYIGINRSYLTHIFKKNIGISPQEFLVNYRIDKACSLLKSSDDSIKYISKSIGYSDPLTFSKIFKKIQGESPKKYRERFSSAIYID